MNPWLILSVVLPIAGSYAAGEYRGRSIERGEQAKAQYGQAIAYAGEIVARQVSVDTLSADLEAARAAQAPKDRIIIKEVVRYESLVPPDRRCTLDGAWRVLHDAAATGIPPDPGATGVAAPTAERVTDAAALDTVAENYQDCREWRAGMIGWQRWWAALVP